jgi:hypothetical protein
MRLWIFVAVALSVTAAAQAERLPRHFDFKGITANDRYDQHKSDFERCDKYMNFNGCRFKDPMVAGAPVSPEAGWASDGSLVLIRASFSSSNFERINEGFRAKWGEPDTYVEQQVQNGFGAKLTIPVAVWKFAEGEMSLIGPNFRHTGSFEYQSHARKLYMDGLKKPKADF